eukprot:TRINITY_DN248_c1_g1_i1.p1 TRINITY_DN248_c1_g1~~TRINITY_DN248_c1_g1_i1.p1  ORF type:complete len:103 (+),score=31.67 TRINITY_DN248_c1_g1_i1:155-463(+)
MDNVEPDTVKLISKEGHEFVVDRVAAMASGTIKEMLKTGPGTIAEQRLGEFIFREISTPVLEKVIQYFYYKMKYTNSTRDIVEFPLGDDLQHLLMAAHFLDT